MDLETAQTNTTAKLPLLKQGEYDMWKLRIEQYFQVQDYALWDVIENGNSFKPAAQTTTNADGSSTTLIPGPVTADEKTQKKNDVKARSMLLMALPNEHLLTFNQYKDAKTLFASIQTRFGGFRRLTASSTSSSSSQNLAFVLSTSNTNEVNTAYGVSTANLNQPNGSHFVHEDLEQIHEDDLEKMDLKWKLALLSMRTRKFFQKTGRKITLNRSDTAGYDKSRNQDSSRRTIYVEEISSKAMLAIDGAGFDWSFMADEEVPTDMALMAFSDSEPEFERYGPKTSKSVSEDRESPDASLVEELVSNDKSQTPRGNIRNWNNQKSQQLGHLQKEDQGYVNSGCSRHMTGNMSYLSDFKEFDGGYVIFGGGAKGERIIVVAGTNFNDSVGTKESASTNHSSEERGSSQDYILMPLWKDGSLFDSSSKDASNDEPQPSNDAGKKDDEGGIDDQERTENSAQDVNTAGQIPTALLESTYVDFFGDESELDLSNIATTYPVPTTPNIRIHKDHLFDHVLGDVQSGVQTRRMINEQGFISAVYEGKTHEDLHTCLFAYFLSQEEPKKVIQALKDPSWIEAINKKDERGIVNRNKARLVAQGYTQEEGIDYDESTFLYGKIEEEFYVYQPPGFEDPEFTDKVYKVEKALYGLHQAPRAWTSSDTKNDGIFISQDKYVVEILKKFGFLTVRTASTPMETSKLLLKDAEAEDVNVHLYRSMIGSLMYLTTSRPDIMFVVCACARFQVTPKVSHLHAVKRIFRYLKGQPKLGLWYPKDSPFNLEAYTNSDYAGASLDRKSTTGGCQFLRRRLISWKCKKQTIVANSTTEAEYVAAASCYGQVLWIQNQMLDYGYNFMNTKIFIDNESTICIVKNPVFHSKIKHMEIRHHFIRDSNEKKLI
ncbi:putative reverse transcriptase, RNA-dependent DNA polymerase [Tanacetum coccineum]